MGSRREEERNEKIVRGLMKLPPNRRCINCNSLGPQYACTNFWTFVCITCSGIHREFTHRVKSVSMAKFTSQEVEALQAGGNQRARETYLKDWDPQRQRLPDNSNVDKVREFIKNVYVDRRYTGGKNSEKPPRDVQSITSPEEETRRASSYHSYSQSPPYDYQYEERRYGKQGAVLTRRPGSDRGPSDGKISSFMYSPGHKSEHIYEDRFANDGSGARVSDYSVSSGGDPFRSGARSPTFQSNAGFSSPPLQPSRANSRDNLNRQTSDKSMEANFRRDANWIPRPQRTASSGSFGSRDSNSVSLNSFNSGSLVDVPESEQVRANHQDKISTSPQLNVPGSSGEDLFQTLSGPEPEASSINLFQAPVEPVPAASASSIDLCQARATFSSPSIDLFQSSTNSSPSPIQHHISQTVTSTSLDFFADFPQHSHVTMGKTLSESSIPQNEGWATFDSPQPPASTPAAETLIQVKIPSSDVSTVENLDLFSTSDLSRNWPSSQKPSSQHASSDKPYASGGNPNNVQVPTVIPGSQPWNAFGEPSTDISSMGIKQNDVLLAAAPVHPSTSEKYLALEVSSELYGVPRSMDTPGPSLQSIPSDGIVEASHTPTPFPPVGETLSYGSAAVYKSTNPFDFPFDTNVEQGNMFLDMSSLQAALPDSQQPTTILGGVTQPWFPQNPLTPYVAVAPQGGLEYVGGQTASSQIANMPAHGPVASMGGNPFA